MIDILLGLGLGLGLGLSNSVITLTRVVTVEFRILGGLEVWTNGRNITPTAPKLRNLLCLFLVHYDSGIDATRVIDELWGGRPPRRAAATVHVYVSQLRRILDDVSASESRIRRDPTGYRLDLRLDDEFDLHRFNELAERSRYNMQIRNVEIARQQLRSALGLTRTRHGPEMNGGGPVVADFVTRLNRVSEELRHLLIEALMELREFRAAITEIDMALRAAPLQESLYVQLMSALHATGRPKEAIETYGVARRLLVTELGIEPSNALRAQFHRVLSGGSQESRT